MCRLFLMFVLSVGCGLATYARLSAADPTDVFQNGDTVVVFGDSITQGGNYIDHFEAFLLCHHPEWKLRVLNRGISSETISGTSERDHDPRRPWAHERFTRDIVPLKPQVLIACFGMNDGNYHPFEWTRFEKYQQGVRRLLQRAKEEAGVRTVVLMTPPPFDPYQRKPGDPNAKEYGYKFPAINYDETLGKYGDWLLSLRGEGIPVVDLHEFLNAHVARRRQESVNFTISPDAVHPNMTGHWLMAVRMMHTLSTPNYVSDDVRKDAGTIVIKGGGDQRVIRLLGCPPIDPGVDAASVALVALQPGLSAPPKIRFPELSEPDASSGTVTRWRAFLDGQPFGVFTTVELQDGVVLPAQPEFPFVRERQKLLAKIRERRTLEYWQFRAGTDKPLGGKVPSEDIPARLASLDAEIEQLRQPMESTVWLEKIRE